LPAASYFLCLAKESNQRKATPLRHPVGAGLDWTEPSGRLRNSPWQGTQNVPCCGARTVLAFIPA